MTEDFKRTLARSEEAVRLQRRHGIDYGEAIVRAASIIPLDAAAVAPADAGAEASAWDVNRLDAGDAEALIGDPSLLRRVEHFRSLDAAADAFGITAADAAQLSQIERRIASVETSPPPPENPHAAWLDARPLDGTEGRHFPAPYADADFERDALRYEAMVYWATDAGQPWVDGMQGELSRAEWSLYARMGKDPVTEVRTAAQQHALNREQHGRLSFIASAQTNLARERRAEAERKEAEAARVKRAQEEHEAGMEAARRSPAVHPYGL